MCETFLEKGKYMVGDSLTVADLSIGAMVATSNAMWPIRKDKSPKLAAYLERMYEIPYFKEINEAGINAVLKALGPYLNAAKL